MRAGDAQGGRDEARARFEALVTCADEEPDPVRAALWIAAEEQGGIDVAGALAQLDALAARARRALPSGGPARVRAEALGRFLFGEEGFAGNRRDYYDPRNSYLDQVLARRTGIPISLALVMLAVARRLELPLAGVGFPGHFLVRWCGESAWLLDPFDGRVVARSECQARLEAALGRGTPLDDAVHLRAATAREILVRVLGNLKHVFVGCGELARALACSERSLLLQPDAPLELLDRAAIYEKLECPSAALADLERCLTLVPGHPEAPRLLAHCERLRQRIGPLH